MDPLARLRRRYATMFEGGTLDGQLVSITFEGDPVESLYIPLMGEDRPEDYGWDDQGRIEVDFYRLVGSDSTPNGVPARTAHYRYEGRSRQRDGVTLRFGV